jgi:hypothetical protein
MNTMNDDRSLISTSKPEVFDQNNISRKKRISLLLIGIGAFIMALLNNMDFGGITSPFKVGVGWLLFYIGIILFVIGLTIYIKS